MLLMGVIGAVLVPVLITKLWWKKSSLGNIKHSYKFIRWFCDPTFIFFNLVYHLVHRVDRVPFSHRFPPKIRHFWLFLNGTVRFPRPAVLFIHGFLRELLFELLCFLFEIVFLQVKLYFVVFDFLDVIAPLFLEIGLQVLVDYHYFIVFLFVPHYFINCFLQLIDMADVNLLLALVLLQDMISGSEASLMLIDRLLQQSNFMSNVVDHIGLFTYFFLQSFIFLLQLPIFRQ